MTALVSPLDNPVWGSLATRHSRLAIRSGLASRYPPEVTPFVSVAEATAEAGRDLLDIVRPGEQVGILSVMPPWFEDWVLVKRFDAYQYVWPPDLPGRADALAVRLTENDVPAMLELTALVYPAYFRSATAALGDYFGIFDGARLCAMAGVRMSLTGHQELSAICTHPDFRGRGLASRLTSHLVDHVLASGDSVFLHTESDNLAAQAVYERLGFCRARVLPFQVVERSPKP